MPIFFTLRLLVDVNVIEEYDCGFKGSSSSGSQAYFITLFLSEEIDSVLPLRQLKLQCLSYCVLCMEPSKKAAAIEIVVDTWIDNYQLIQRWTNASSSLLITRKLKACWSERIKLRFEKIKQSS